MRTLRDRAGRLRTKRRFFRARGLSSQTTRTIDRCAGRDRLPDHQKLIENAVRWTLQDRLPASVNGPGFIDVSVFRQPNGRRIIHLNNLTAADMTGLIKRRLPVYGITLTLPAEGRKSAEAELRRSKIHITVTADQDRFTIPVEKIDDFEVIVV